jgi:hypothetical protein
MRRFALALAVTVLGAATFSGLAMAGDAPDLRGTWRGYSDQVSAKHGYVERENTINITDQNGRRFRGTVTHAGGTEKFIGIIRSKNKKFYWVDVEDDGIVFGKIIRPDVLETCYLDAGEDAVAGCSTLVRQR